MIYLNILPHGGSFTNETMLETYGLLGIAGPGTILNAIFLVMSDAGNIVFANLPIIFAKRDTNTHKHPINIYV